MPSDPQRVQSIFLAAVEVPAADRSAVLDRECGSDAELRQRVEALLRAHDAPGSLLDEPAAAPVVTADSGPPEAADGTPAEAVGSRIGPYKLVQQLGEGGMGAVWVAEQTEPLLKEVYAGMRQRADTIPPQGKVRLTEALERLVQLYEAIGRPDEAARWRKEQEEMRAAQAPGKPS